MEEYRDCEDCKWVDEKFEYVVQDPCATCRIDNFEEKEKRLTKEK